MPNFRSTGSLLVASANYRDAILQAGPVGYWRLNDAVGSLTAADLSGSGNAGTAYGGVTFGQAGPLVGNAATAAAFDGSTGYIGVSKNPLLGVQAGSLTAWMKTTSTASQGLVSVVQQNVSWLDLYMDGTKPGEMRFEAGSNLGYVQAFAGSVADGYWHHVAQAYSGTVLTGYIDGSQVAQIGGGTALNFTSPVTHIGNYAGYFSGTIAEVAIYNYALSAAQIAYFYSLGQALFGLGLGYPNPIR